MMEIKDINSGGLLNMLQAAKGNFPGGATGLSGFGDLLAGLESSREAVVEKTPEFTERKETAAAKFSKPSVKEKLPAANKRDEAKTEKSRREVVGKAEKDTGRRAEGKSSSGAETSSETSKVGLNDENAFVAEGNAEYVEKSEEAPAMENGDDVSEVYEVSLDALALMGSVAVVNPVSGEVFETTGAELAVGLSEAGIENVMAEPSSEMLRIMPVSDASADADAFQEILQAMQPVDGEVAEVIPSEALVSAVKPVKGAAAETVEDMPELEAQAAELGKVAGGEHKVKVEVNVKAEKIADLVDKDLMSARLGVNEKTLPSSETDIQNPLIDSEASLLQPADNQNAAQIKNAALAPAAAAGNMVSEAVADVAPANVENSSVSLASAGTAGGEMLANARPVPANDGASSFRDVYKGMGREVVEQIKVNITKSAVKGVDTIEIQLKPEDLGKIEIKMQIGKDGKLQAHIVSSRPETAEVLQKEVSNLQKAFEEAGFQTDENSLNFSFRDDGQAGRGQERNSLRSFIGNALEQETVMDAAGSDLFAGTAWDGNGGLNIRV